MNRFQVTANFLQLRKDPSLTGDFAGTLSAGDIVERFKVSGDDYWYKIRRADGISGWATHKHLMCLDHDAYIADEEFPWMAAAIRELGARDYVGAAENPRITAYLSSTTVGKARLVENDIPWNAAFVNWCVEQSGCDGTDSAWANAWRYWGQSVKTPCRGCIVLLRAGRVAHVGFYVDAVDETIRVLGANQPDAVTYAHFAAADVVSYRVPN